MSLLSDLVTLDVVGYDVILEMHRLPEHHAKVYYHQGCICFSSPSQPKLQVFARSLSKIAKCCPMMKVHKYLFK